MGGVDKATENFNNENFFLNYREVWRNPATGAKFQATEQVRFTGNSPGVENFTLRCVGAPTILPWE